MPYPPPHRRLYSQIRRKHLDRELCLRQAVDRHWHIFLPGSMLTSQQEQQLAMGQRS